VSEQPELIDDEHAERTQRAAMRHREWFVEREDDHIQCANKLDAITNNDGGFVWQVQPMEDGTFTIIWWMWKD
jgi:hypothetical protein